MARYIFEGFILGISTGIACGVTCIPFLIPVFSCSGKKGLSRAFVIFALFSLGRFAAYMLFGTLTVLTGYYISAFPLSQMLKGILLMAAAAAVLFLIHSGNSSHKACIREDTPRGIYYTPLLLGFLAGINLCPPFVLLITAVLRLSSPTYGIIMFISFFTATTLVLLPCIFGIYLFKIRFLSGAIRTISVLIAIYFFITGAATVKNQIIEARSIDSPGRQDITSLAPESDVIQACPFNDYVFCCYKDRKITGYIIISEGFGKFTGFGGQLVTAIITDPGLTVEEFKLIRHNETASYVELIKESGFFEKFQGVSPWNFREKRSELDSVSGATISSSAILDSFLKSYAGASIYFEDTVHLREKPDFKSVISVIAIVFPFITASLYVLFKREALRYFTMLYSLIILGFWKKTMLTGEHLANFLTGSVLSQYNIALFIFIITLIVFTVIFGNLYCSSICPLGSLQSFLGRLNRKKIIIREPFERRLGKARFILLFIILAAYTVNIRIPSSRFEPFGTLFSLKGDLIAWSIVIAALMSSIVIDRFWCRFFCPAGAFQKMLSSLRNKQ
ncbi:MAG: 4Fe-4S binding protein [Candidatus Aureabacteria bacterium]|nr:4Fe-4S binding protein [Candidatus Auribacterota bacterium]